MEAKTIFLNNLDEILIYESRWHDDNYNNYINKYYSNLKVTEFIPLLLTKQNHCVIDLSTPYDLGVIYLPIWLTEFQKEYFTEQRKIFEKYTLYLNGYSFDKPIEIDELLNIIRLTPIRPKEKKLM